MSLAMDQKSSEYYNIEIEVAKCTFQFLCANFDKFKYVVVYQTTSALHCVYVQKIQNGNIKIIVSINDASINPSGKLCCINSHGNKNQFPQLKPGINIKLNDYAFK